MYAAIIFTFYVYTVMLEYSWIWPVVAIITIMLNIISSKHHQNLISEVTYKAYSYAVVTCSMVLKA